jgi:hypothetical protein
MEDYEYIGSLRRLAQNPCVVCLDGFQMSVQASEDNYSTPRESGCAAYTHVDVGFPSEADPLLTPYMECPGDPTESIYPYVPSEVVEAVISRHGGIVSGRCPAGVYPSRPLSS